MNFFFSLKTKTFNSRLSIPKFQNRGKINNKIKLFSAKISNKNGVNIWKYENVLCDENEYFFIVKNKNLENKKFYFLASENDMVNFDCYSLKKINNFTNTTPEFRVNSRLFLKNGAFSSYQSDYPHKMLNINGSIVSPLNSLLSKHNSNNKIIFINIYEKPIVERINYFIVNIKKEKILKKGFVFTNSMNEINIQKNFIMPENFFFTQKYVGIPVYVSYNKNNISCEHTHPMTEYLFGEKKYILVRDFKNKINEIIKKN